MGKQSDFARFDQATQDLFSHVNYDELQWACREVTTHALRALLRITAGGHNEASAQAGNAQQRIPLQIDDTYISVEVINDGNKHCCELCEQEITTSTFSLEVFPDEDEPYCESRKLCHTCRAMIDAYLWESSEETLEEHNLARWLEDRHCEHCKNVDACPRMDTQIICCATVRAAYKGDAQEELAP